MNSCSSPKCFQTSTYQLWQLDFLNCSGQKPWSHARFLSFSQTLSSLFAGDSCGSYLQHVSASHLCPCYHPGPSNPIISTELLKYLTCRVPYSRVVREKLLKHLSWLMTPLLKILQCLPISLRIEATRENYKVLEDSLHSSLLFLTSLPIILSIINEASAILVPKPDTLPP